MSPDKADCLYDCLFNICYNKYVFINKLILIGEIMSEEIRFFDQQKMYNLATFSENFYAYFSDEEITVFPYSPAVFDKSFRFTITDLLQTLNNILALPCYEKTAYRIM